jgi:hypothetical protein
LFSDLNSEASVGVAEYLERFSETLRLVDVGNARYHLPRSVWLDVLKVEDVSTRWTKDDQAQRPGRAVRVLSPIYF